MIKVIRMVTTHGHNPVSESYKMEQLYAAAEIGRASCRERV